MASSIGPAASRQATVRPVLVRVISPASDNTSRCFITAGNDMANGCASSLTDKSAPADRRARSARRVGSARAVNVRFKAASEYLTMKLSLSGDCGKSRNGWDF